MGEGGDGGRFPERERERERGKRGRGGRGGERWSFIIYKCIKVYFLFLFLSFFQRAVDVKPLMAHKVLHGGVREVGGGGGRRSGGLLT